MTKKTKIRAGDVFEVKTKRGLAYAQYVMRNLEMGALIRVLPGLHKTRPVSLTEVVAQQEQFVTFFPLQAAIDQEVFEIVAHETVPDESRKMPLFRARGHIDREGFVHDWRLWDGEKSTRVGKLTPEQRKFPIKEIWNDTLLIERIEQGWTPEQEPVREPGALRKFFRA